MSALQILILIALLIWAYGVARLWRAARLHGEDEAIVYICILAWPVLAVWLFCRIVGEAGAELRRWWKVRHDCRD